MSGFAKNPDAAQRMIGAHVLALRSQHPPVKWKDIERLYARGRAQLWRYAQFVSRGTKVPHDAGKKDVSRETVKHLSSGLRGTNS